MSPFFKFPKNLIHCIFPESFKLLGADFKKLGGKVPKNGPKYTTKSCFDTLAPW